MHRLSCVTRSNDKQSAMAVSGRKHFAATLGQAAFPSDVQRFEIGHTLLRQFPVLFDEVVFNAADFGGGEGFYPIDAAFAHRNLWPLARGALHVYVLEMHRVKAAWVFREIFRGDEASGIFH